MDIRLVDIIGVDPRWEIVHTVKALEINGKTPATSDLARLQKDDPSEYRKIMEVIKEVAGKKRVKNPGRVKADAKKRGVYEMRGKYARLFFFYTADTDEIVVCANLYRKTDSSIKKQESAFARCAELKECFERTQKRKGI